VVGCSYEELDEEVFVGDDPVDVVVFTRCGDAGEDKVSSEDRVDAVGTATVVVSVRLALATVGANGNFILGESCCG